MKKLLGSTLALAMFVPAGANAELLKNFKVGGQLDVQTTMARNIEDFATRQDRFAAGDDRNDRIGHANTRLMVKADWDVLDDVHGRVTLVKGASNQGGARTYGQASQTLNGLQDTITAEEANVKIDKLFGALDTTIGRQFYGEPGDLIVYFGPRDNYGLTVTALDAFRADWAGEHMNLTLVAGKTADGALAATGNAATDLRGIVLSCTKHENVKPSVYVYNRVQHAIGALGAQPTVANGVVNGKNGHLYVAGVKAKLAFGGLSAHVEAAKNFGEDRVTDPTRPVNYKGYAVLGKAAYKVDLDNMGMIMPWGEFGMGTGDSNYEYRGNNTFQSIATDYRPGGIYGRFDQTAAIALGGALGSVASPAPYASGGNPASNGLSNRVIWGAGVKATPTMAAKLTLGAQYYRYAFHRVSPGLIPATNATGKTSRNIGSEIDVTAEWKHSENVTLKATAGTFLPGAYIKDRHNQGNLTNPIATNPATMLAGDVTIRF